MFLRISYTNPASLDNIYQSMNEQTKLIIKLKCYKLSPRYVQDQLRRVKPASRSLKQS